ncbi:MAG: ribonuclease HII [Thermoproteota archaeon]
MTLVMGVDEAGRGCVIGPLVVAMAGVDSKDVTRLLKIGVRDSKKLTPAGRLRVASDIRRVASLIRVRRISASNIDRLRGRGVSLNEIEAMLIGSIVSGQRGVLYVDSVDRNCERFRRMILKHTRGFSGRLVVRNYLDESNPIVGAASIVAKVERDRAVRRILRKAGLPECSGYSGDPDTIRLLKEVTASGSGVGFIRRSWSTVARIRAELEQSKISSF